MFKNISEARAEAFKRLVSEGGITPPVTRTEFERIVSHLAPQFWIGRATGNDAKLGGTRFGGAPDLPRGTTWPMRPIPNDADRQAAELTKNFAWIARHVVRELPFEFLAQIDLAEAGADAAAFGLPDHGRLLFFWDGVLGLGAGGAQLCRVVWDTSARETLAHLTVPPVMAELEAAYDPSGKYTKPYVYPSRPMRLEPILHLPDALSCDMLADEALSHRLNDVGFTLRYSQLLGDWTGFRGRPDSHARRQRFMGTPQSEQRDPRLQAIESDLPPYPWPADTVRLAMRRALEWQQLLQLDLNHLTQNEFVTGTVYFVIRRDDLARRDFSRVHAIHQST